MERRLSLHNLCQNDAKAPYVYLVAVGHVFQDFGRDVSRGAAVGPRATFDPIREHLREPKIYELDMASILHGEHDVLGLQVPVDYALALEKLQR